jgi:hypothetical protein
MYKYFLLAMRLLLDGLRALLLKVTTNAPPLAKYGTDEML